MPLIDPFIMSNRGGIPRLEATKVTVNTDNITYSFKPHVYLGSYFTGLLLFKLPSYTAPTTAVPIVFDTAGRTINLTTLSGANVTSDELSASGVYLAFYDGSTLQLLTGI